jgi:hypothetical protein
MNRSLLASSLLWSALLQAQQTTFQKTIGGSQIEYAYDAHKTLEGGYVFGGPTMSFPSPGNVASYIVRTDPDGDTLWTAAFGGTAGNCDMQYINDLTQISDSGFLAVGGKGVCGNPNGGGNIVRLDKNGNVLWAKYNNAYADPYPVIQSNDGNFIVGGYIQGIGAGLKDAPLIKLDANGDTIWARNYGGAGDDWFYHIVQTNDNGYLAAGKTTSFGQGGNDIYLVKTDASGNLMWSKAYGTAGEEVAFGHSLEPTSDGGYILTGYGDVVQGPKGMFLLKIDVNGNMSWSKYYTGMDAHAVKQTPDGGYVLTGRSSTGVQLVKTDQNGNVTWSKVYTGGTSEKGLILVLAGDGGYLVGGQGAFNGNTEFYMIKTDANGNSGCNEANAGVTSSNAPFIMVNAGTLVSVGEKTVSYPLLYQRGGTVTGLCSTVGETEEVKKNEFAVFPNPCDGIFTVPSAACALITVYNSLGAELFSVESTTYRTAVDLKDQPGGMYFIAVQEGNKIDVQRIIITK